MRIVLRSLAVLAATACIAGCQSTGPLTPGSSLTFADPGKRCPPGTELTDEVVAAALGIDLVLLDRLHRLRDLSNERLCDVPARVIKRAIVKVTPKTNRGDHPAEWAHFRALRQRDESGTVRPEGLIEALEERKAMVAAQVRAEQEAGVVDAKAAGISSQGWTSIGPGNIGGRIRSILIHPTLMNLMWVGSVSGGIWASTDGGASWNPLTDFMGNLSVSSLVMDPTDYNVMYAGTGEGVYTDSKLRGAGIFKSTDGGATWNPTASTNPVANADWYYVNRLAMHPTNKLVMLAATNGGVYRTIDGGSTWAKVFAQRSMDVRFDPRDGAKALVGQMDGTIAYSTNTGASFASATLPNYPAAVPVVPKGRVELAYPRSGASNTAFAVADAHDDPKCIGCAILYTTADAGVTWTALSTPNHLGPTGFYASTVWVDPTNPKTLIVGGLDLWKSTNGGTGTWAKLSAWEEAPLSAHADHHVIVAHPAYNGTTNTTVYFGNDGGLYKAQSLGALGTVAPWQAGWTMINNGLGITQFYSGAGRKAAGAGRIVGGTQDNGDLVWSPGNGTSWQTWAGGDGGFSAVDSADDNFIYGEYVFLSIRRSVTGGLPRPNSESDLSICAGITEANSTDCRGTGQVNFIAPLILDPNNNNRLLAGARSLWVSDNVKQALPTWRALKPPAGDSCDDDCISAIAVAEGNSNAIWIGLNKGRIFKTSNGNVASPGVPTWTEVTGGLPTGRMVLRFLIDKADPNIVYVTFGGFSAGNVWKTTNGGAAWTNIGATLPSVPVGTIVRHPAQPAWLYVGTEVGLFTSENGGSTWTATRDGPANVPVEELFWYDNNTLVAATHGRGMFMSTVAPAAVSYYLSVSKSSGSGTVTSNPAGLDCGPSVQVCGANYAGGVTVVLTATPAAGSVFAGWLGACSGTGTCSVSMTTSKAVTANFLPADDNWPPGGAMPAGWVQPSGSTAPWAVASDSVFSGSFSLKSGRIFDNLRSDVSFTGTFLDGTVSFARRVSSEAIYDELRFFIDGVLMGRWSGEVPWSKVAFPISAGTHTLLWSFAKDTSTAQGSDAAWIDSVLLPVTARALTITKSGTGTGVVTTTPTGIACGTTCTASFASGALVTLIAKADVSAVFGGWGGACTGNGTCTVAMDAAKTVTASFTAKAIFALTVAKAGTGSGIVESSTGIIKCGATCTDVFYAGTLVTLTPTAATESVFAGWSGACTGVALCVVPMTAAQNVTATFNKATVAALTATPTSLAFGGQSMNTTAPAQTVTIRNPGSSAVTVSDVATTTNFAGAHNCTPTIPAGATCKVDVTFTPSTEGAITGVLGVASSAGLLTIALSGTGEKSLVTHYYRSILRRAPDDGGKAYWNSEAARVQALGVNVNEVWFALAQQFYSSAEYTALNRDATGYVTDLYTTFFNRAPDTGGRDYWVGLINQGLPREVVLLGFMFSSEFTGFTQALFGAPNTRKELDTVTDFYRGLLARLPDDGGFNYWVGQFRSAQCSGAAAVTAQAEAISSAYASSGEYTGRNRSDTQFVSDMYNAFLRRAGDLGGVQFWISQIATGARTRENVRQQFVASPEFSARVQGVIAQGCLQ